MQDFEILQTQFNTLGTSLESARSLFRETGPMQLRTWLQTTSGELIIARLLNEFDQSIENIKISTVAFDDRFSEVIGHENGVDSTEWQALGQNLIQSVFELKEKIEDLSKPETENIELTDTTKESMSGDAQNLAESLEQFVEHIKAIEEEIEDIIENIETIGTALTNLNNQLIATNKSLETVNETLFGKYTNNGYWSDGIEPQLQPNPATLVDGTVWINLPTPPSVATAHDVDIRVWNESDSVWDSYTGADLQFTERCVVRAYNDTDDTWDWHNFQSGFWQKGLTIDNAGFIDTTNNRLDCIDTELAKKENILTAGTGISIDRTNPDSPIINSTGLILPNRWTSTEIIADGLEVGDPLDNLDLTLITPIGSTVTTLAENDIVIFGTGLNLQVSDIDDTNELYSGVVISVPVTDINATHVAFESALPTPTDPGDPTPITTGNVRNAIDELTERNQAVNNKADEIESNLEDLNDEVNKIRLNLNNTNEALWGTGVLVAYMSDIDPTTEGISPQMGMLWIDSAYPPSIATALESDISKWDGTSWVAYDEGDISFVADNAVSAWNGTNWGYWNFDGFTWSEGLTDVQYGQLNVIRRRLKALEDGIVIEDALLIKESFDFVDTNVFTLREVPVAVLNVFAANDILVDFSDYTIADDELTIDYDLEVGDRVRIDYFANRTPGLVVDVGDHASLTGLHYDVAGHVGFARDSDIPTVASDIGAIDVAEKGTPNGVGTLDVNGQQPISEFPFGLVPQSDWNESNNLQTSYIRNKPTGLSQFANDTQYTNLVQLNNESLARIAAVNQRVDKADFNFVNVPDGTEYNTTGSVTTNFPNRQVVSKVVADSTGLNVEQLDVINGTRTQTSIPMPVANQSQNGLMSSAQARAISDNTTAIESLQGRGARYVVTIPATPSQSQLQALFETAANVSVGTEAPDSTRLIDLSTNTIYEFFAEQGEWENISAVDVPVAGDGTLGVVSGVEPANATPGDVVVTNGSMKAFGVDTATANIGSLQTGLNTANGNISDLTGRVTDVENNKLDATTFNDLVNDGTSLVSSGDRALWDAGGQGLDTAMAAIDAERISRQAADSVLLPQTNINTNVVGDLSYSVVNQTAQANINVFNPVTQSTATLGRAIPIASSTVTGLMPRETVATIGSHESRISAIEGRVSRYSVTIPDNPSQQQLNDLYYVASQTTIGDPIPDGTRLVDDTFADIVYDFFTSDGLWHLSQLGPLGLASQSVAGIVQGSEDDGDIRVNSDGTMTMNGYNQMSIDIDNLESKVDGLQIFKEFAGPIYRTPTGWPQNSLVAYRSGSTVMIYMNTGSVSPPTSVANGVLPIGFRPPFDLEIIGGMTTNDKTGIVRIFANGNIQGSIGNSAPVRICQTFITPSDFPT
jgi:hypothetical protein